jgi:hypothetical protein
MPTDEIIQIALLLPRDIAEGIARKAARQTPATTRNFLIRDILDTCVRDDDTLKMILDRKRQLNAA